MKKLRLLTVFLLLQQFQTLTAQCLFGDCNNGFGEAQYKDSSTFIGTFQSGQKKNGLYNYRNGDEYFGEFSNGKRNGFGRYKHNSGDVFKGLFIDDKKTDGEYSYKNGDVYNGCIENNKPNGYGKMKFKGGQIVEGSWSDGKPAWSYSVTNFADSLKYSLNDKSYDWVPENNSKGISPKVYAVIVGVSDYDGVFNDLRYADDDATYFYNQLIKSMPRETQAGKVVRLLNKEATASNVINALTSTFGQSSENDYVIFYFSGHGSPGEFIPVDHYSSTITHDQIKNLFKQTNAKYRLCIADACFAGSIGNEDSYSSSTAASQGLKDSRLAVILSSKSSQTSLENSSLKQGLFSFYLIKGMRGAADLNKDKYVTAGELFLYTRTRVNAQSNGKQVPVIYGKNIDRIPLSKIK